MSTMINWPARFAEMIDFVGLSEEDRQLIKASAPLILARAGSLNDFVYDALLKYPQSRQFFVTAHDEPDAKRIEDNKQTMLSWLRATVAAPLNDGYITLSGRRQSNAPQYSHPQAGSAPCAAAFYYRYSFILSDGYHRFAARAYVR